MIELNEYKEEFDLDYMIYKLESGYVESYVTTNYESKTDKEIIAIVTDQLLRQCLDSVVRRNLYKAYKLPDNTPPADYFKKDRYATRVHMMDVRDVEFIVSQLKALRASVGRTLYIPKKEFLTIKP